MLNTVDYHLKTINNVLTSSRRARLIVAGFLPSSFHLFVPGINFTLRYNEKGGGRENNKELPVLCQQFDQLSRIVAC